MKISFGDIYLVNFEPNVGREYSKKRPGLVIQEKIITEHSPYITVMPLSSKYLNFKVPDVFIPKDEKNRLISDSIIKVQQISSFDKSRFIKFIGRAKSPIIRRVRGYLRRHFGL